MPLRAISTRQMAPPMSPTRNFPQDPVPQEMFMYKPQAVTTSAHLPLPDRMRAWVLGDPDQLLLIDKQVPVPARAEVLVRIDAVAICATDLDIIHSGSPASIKGGLPFNKNF